MLLSAAQKGPPLTPRMARMLADVRSQALALAGCFTGPPGLAEPPGWLCGSG